MSAYETLLIEHDGPVDWLTLNRPERMNAINGTMVRELWTHLSELEQDYSRRILVLRGAGDAFCAGLDLKSLGDPAERLPDGLDSAGPSASLPGIVRLLRRIPQPVIALLKGPACGGGFALALASDIRLAGTSARMNDAFVRLGLSGCELGLSWFLPRMLGLSLASELMFTGGFIDAQRAEKAGLVSQAMPDDELEAAARSLIEQMLRTTPVGLRKTKETLNRAMLLNDLDSVIELEAQTQISCMQGGDFAEAIAAFREKREPRFGAR